MIRKIPRKNKMKILQTYKTLKKKKLIRPKKITLKKLMKKFKKKYKQKVFGSRIIFLIRWMRR